jgi:hypothetical protein
MGVIRAAVSSEPLLSIPPPFVGSAETAIAVIPPDQRRTSAGIGYVCWARGGRTESWMVGDPAGSIATIPKAPFECQSLASTRRPAVGASDPWPRVAATVRFLITEWAVQQAQRERVFMPHFGYPGYRLHKSSKRRFQQLRQSLFFYIVRAPG